MINDKDFAKWFYAMQMSKGHSVDENMMATWYELLKEMPADRVENAFKKIVYSPDDFPTVGKIIEMIEPVRAQATLAWLDVLQIASTGKEPGGVLGHIVQKMGGIDKIGYCESEFEMSKLQRQFCEIYALEADNIRMEKLEHSSRKELTGGQQTD